MSNQSFGKNRRIFICSIVSTFLLFAGAGTTICLQYNEIERLRPLAELGEDVQEERRLQAQRAIEEDFRWNEQRANAQQELSIRGFPISCYERELGYAVKNNNTEMLRLLLIAGAKANSPLVFSTAAENGYTECVKLLLEHTITKGNEDYKLSWYAYALSVSARNGHAECMKLLLDVPGIDVNKDKYGSFPLYVAAENGHAECVKLLLDVPGIDVNKDKNGSTPLYVAAENGYAECVKLLLDAPGIDINRTKDNFSPLFVASENGHIECVKILEAAGARK